MTIEQVKIAIKDWNLKRNLDEGLQYLTGGYGFSISREEFNKWEAINLANPATGEEITHIHVCFGVLGSQMNFFLVDSLTDANEGPYTMNDTVFAKSFTKPNYEGSTSGLTVPALPPEVVRSLSRSAASARMLRWMLYSDRWFKLKQIEQSNNPDLGVTRGVAIPYADIKSMFTGGVDPLNEVSVFLGIEDLTFPEGASSTQPDLELMVGPRVENTEQTWYKDVSLPCPPFSLSGQGFNLILNSAASLK